MAMQRLCDILICVGRPCSHVCCKARLIAGAGSNLDVALWLLAVQSHSTKSAVTAALTYHTPLPIHT